MKKQEPINLTAYYRNMKSVKCSTCERKSYSSKPGDLCEMPQPEGSICPGTFLKEVE